MSESVVLAMVLQSANERGWCACVWCFSRSPWEERSTGPREQGRTVLGGGRNTRSPAAQPTGDEAPVRTRQLKYNTRPTSQALHIQHHPRSEIKNILTLSGFPRSSTMRGLSVSNIGQGGCPPLILRATW